MLRAFAALVAALLVVGSHVACGGDDFSSAQDAGPPVPCNEDPWTCRGGQTCWVNPAGDGFACLNAGPGGQGASCGLAPGSVACAAGLFCSFGTCTSFCDSEQQNRKCPDTLVCKFVTITDETMTVELGDVQVCLPP
jgi:hypothetical protein